MSTEAEIYKALGDPTRLEIVKRLSSKRSCAIGELCKDLGISRQGARKQLQILVNANIASLKCVGRETKVALDITSLQQAQRFIAQLEKEWESRLLALKNYVESDK
ncbi:helix-turn-helix domain-containing protein [Alteromonas ponticola]|uniref:Helix-turn-helix domain-containing protein n=1 Tax=Alteromonas aquimaris TaxID=2998417 RepID=A0ABT3P5V6_9ALTE|nr:helix-turn-helix domain-containing protein [Alteromonas aquimaris]MCW8108149.1 helix-turn-helix domain-containing protein [Alteromonas aquimaris]